VSDRLCVMSGLEYYFHTTVAWCLLSMQTTAPSSKSKTWSKCIESTHCEPFLQYNGAGTKHAKHSALQPDLCSSRLHSSIRLQAEAHIEFDVCFGSFSSEPASNSLPLIQSLGFRCRGRTRACFGETAAGASPSR
jgi:hypothetical protein